MAEELKACPFCHREAQQILSSGLVSCAHESCPAFLLAVFPEHWNTRAQLPSQGGKAVAWMLADAVGGSMLEFQRDLLLENQCRYGGEIVPLYTHPADQVVEGGQYARDSEELRSLCAARDQYRDLSIKYGDKLSVALQLLTRCQEHLDPHRDAALWSDVCAALGPKP